MIGQRFLPASLFGRLILILLLGLTCAHIFTFALVLMERGQASMRMMVSYLASDVAASVAILDRVPVDERNAWIARVQRPNYRYSVAAPSNASAPVPDMLLPILDALRGSLEGYEVKGEGHDDGLRLHLGLRDGTPLRIDIGPPRLMLSPWIGGSLLLQLLLLALACWLAVRLAVKPLRQLADAADALRPDAAGPVLPERGPREVARAAKAFNAMQGRIAGHVAERLQILAAVSHDLQTPITRLKLRADLLDDAALRAKLHGDLDAMQALVREGLAYARSAHGATEAAVATDLHALLDSLACDYADAGQQVTLKGSLERPLLTRPRALRRIVANLTDNALKFAGAAEIELSESDGGVAIAVLDRGPGIPEAELGKVLQPFYRLEASRSRETGGTGLGLAIAQQLTEALGGRLVLNNRAGGGLEARLILPLG